MAGYKKDKQIKQREAPKGKHIMRAVDPEQYYSQKPAWSFAYADQEKWAFSKSRLENVFWSDVFPKMREPGNKDLGRNTDNRQEAKPFDRGRRLE